MFQPFEGIPDYPALEKEILQFWEKEQIFQKLRAQTQNGPHWDFQDGPITANNPMGVHHAWGRTYKDIFNRFHALRGERLRWQNGFDCQGLWVEVEVEKALGFNGKPDILRFGVENFSRECRKRVEKFAAVISEQSKRLGMWMDWERSYFTYDDSNIEGIWLFLQKCHEEGWLAPDYRVMPWCPRCETSLSQHESADSYREVTHRSVFVKFPILVPESGAIPSQNAEFPEKTAEFPEESANFPRKIAEKRRESARFPTFSGDSPREIGSFPRENSKIQPGDHFLVWTTTPWTLTANVAVALNPDLPYVRVQSEGETLILSKGTLQSALKPGYQILGEIPGSELVGLTYSGPFDDLPLQIESQNAHPRRSVAWAEVGETEGTGIVHIAPGCGAEDFDLGRRENLGFITPVEPNARFKSDCGPLSGLHGLENVETIFAELEKRGRIYRIQRYKHSYPHCWRCAHELIFFATQEWFIKADAGQKPARGRLKKAAATVNWLPDYAGKRMQDWLDNMGDWNISRKRFWGLPLPIYRDEESGEWEVIGSRAQLRERAVEPEKVDALPELHRPWIDEIEIWNREKTRKLKRIPEVGDAWLDAGIVPFSTVGYNGADDIRMPELKIASKSDWQPADFITEMREQVRLWFFSMLFMGVALEDRAPYKTAMVYETMLTQDGDRISKSLGNGVPYDEAVDQVGADPMRWTFCGNALTKDIRFGYKSIHESARKLLTLWNVYSFFVTYANLDQPDLERSAGVSPASANAGVSPALQSENILDKWILARLQAVIFEVTAALEKTEPAGVTRSVEAFIEDLSTWYVRRSRRRFWKGESDSDKGNAYRTLHHVLKTLCQLIAPVLPFTAEKIYQNLSKTSENAPESVHLCVWPVVDENLRDEALVREVEGVLQAVSLGHAARKESLVKVRQPLSRVLIQAPDGPGRAGLEAWRETILEELNVKELELLDDAGDLVSYSLKANLPVVGRKYGKQVGALRQVLENADAGEAKRIGEAAQSGKSVEIELNGEKITLEPDEILVETRQQSGYSFASEGGWSVGLDTALTPELELEGLARDFVRAIQQARKAAGFEVSDRIAIILAEPDDTSRLIAVLEKFGDYIQSETLADELRLVGGDYPELLEAKMGEETVRVRVEKI